jgi:fucose permease
LQALHFFYGLGAFLAPMIVEPFLLNVDCTSFIDPAAHANTAGPVIHVPSSSSAVAAHPSVNETLGDPVVSLELAQKHSRVQYAFLIMALLQVLGYGMISLHLTDNSRASSFKKNLYENTYL